MDALRGFAALVVLTYHTGSTRLIPGGYLAVDLFFCLSGFVLAHAYEKAELGLGAFLKVRLIRLYPLYFVGWAAGLLVISVGWPNVLAGLAFLPAVSKVDGTYRPYPLDIPAWSLLFEILVNLLWFPIRRAGTRILLAIAAVGAILVLAILMSVGSIDVGSTGEWFLVQGMGRVIFPFVLGALLHRLWAAGVLGFTTPWWLAPLLLAVMFMIPGPRMFADGLAALVLAPLIVAIGACAREPPRLRRIFNLLGESSYPIYILHSVVLAVLLGRISTTGHGSYIVAAVAIPAVLVLGWAMAVFYDRPVRRWLMSRFARGRG